MVVIDGTDLIFGRLATSIAKRLLNGESVQLINAEKLIISGKPSSIIEKYKNRRAAQNKATPEHSPKWPRVPHLLVKRMIRGMLPRTTRGREALKRLMVYTGNPKKLENPISFSEIKHDKNKPFITIEELCKRV
jgi:large subunit ribosomal protein L13